MSTGEAWEVEVLLGRSIFFALCFVVATHLDSTPAAAVGQRVALVVGNSAYKHVSALPNPKNDAEDIAGSLQRIGFTSVVVHRDLGRDGMLTALKNFSDVALGADIALIFYAGHGVELDGRNYLIPVDAALAKDVHVHFEAIALDQVLDTIATATRLRLVILDACRNNPFKARMVMTRGQDRGLGRGLRAVEPVGDTLIAFAAKEGTTAEDGYKTRNSPYTTALLRYIAEPGLDVRLMLGKVRDAVRATTKQQQIPHVYGTLGGEAVTLVPAPTVPARPDPEVDRAFFDQVKDSRDPRELQAYLDQFPTGAFSGLVRLRLEDLRGQPPAAKLDPARPATPVPGTTPATVQPPPLSKPPAITTPPLATVQPEPPTGGSVLDWLRRNTRPSDDFRREGGDGNGGGGGGGNSGGGDGGGGGGGGNNGGGFN